MATPIIPPEYQMNRNVGFDINSTPTVDPMSEQGDKDFQGDPVLKDLYSQSGQETLVYPREILEQNPTKHFIMFQAFDVKGITLEETRQAVNGAVDLARETAGNIGEDVYNESDDGRLFTLGSRSVQGVVRETIEILTSQGGLQQTGRILNQDNSLRNRFSVTSKTDILGKKKELKDTIILYTPENLSVSYNADYAMDNTEVASGLRAAMDTFRAGAGASRNQQADASKAIRDILINAKIKLGKASLNLFGQDVSGSVGSTTRKVLNPHMEFLFSQISQRSFNYTFNFAPRSKQEVEMVHKIIKKFKYHAHPVYDFKSTFLGMPSEFDIVFYSSNKENRYINRVMPCALTNIEVNYAPNGTPSFFMNDGDEQGQSPTNIILSLTFSEVGLLDRRHIDAGY